MGRPQARWEFGYRELAQACGVEENTIRQHVSRGTLKPDDLISVVTFVAAMGTEDIGLEIFRAMTRRGSYGYGCEVGAAKRTAATKKPKIGINRSQG